MGGRLAGCASSCSLTERILLVRLGWYTAQFPAVAMELVWNKTLLVLYGLACLPFSRDWWRYPLGRWMTCWRRASDVYHTAWKLECELAHHCFSMQQYVWHSVANWLLSGRCAMPRKTATCVHRYNNIMHYIYTSSSYIYIHTYIYVYIYTIFIYIHIYIHIYI